MTEYTERKAADAAGGSPLQAVVMPRCKTCDNWVNGKCVRLGGIVEDGDTFPSPREDSLVWAWPVCAHDGAAVEFETDGSFGCVHHSKFCTA